MSDSVLTELDRLFDREGEALVKTFQARHVTISKCGIEMRRTLDLIRRRGWQTHEPIWNSCLFLNRVAHDHSMFFIDFVSERDQERRRLIARSLALVLYEIAEDLPTQFGKDFRDSTSTLAVPDELVLGLNDGTKKVSDFWREHRSFLKELRAIAAAHRDHDAVLLCDTIDQLDLSHLFKIALELGVIMNGLGASAQAIISHTASVRPPELESR